MSGRLVGEILDNAPIDLTLLDRFVLVALAETAQDKDRVARYHASGDRIADRIGSTPGSVRNALLRLKDRGLIVPMLDRPGRGRSQEWYLPKLHAEHRRAVLTGAPGSDTK